MSESPRPPRGRPSKVSRRQALLAGAAGLVGAAAAPLAGQTADQAARARVPADPTKVQGPGGTDVGARSPFERPVRTTMGAAGRRTSTQTPLQDLTGIITPADLHFERHHAGVPAIDPERYSLLIHGMVERPTVFTLADLKRFPAKSVIRFLECSGNGGRAYRRDAADVDVTPQQIDGLTSTSEWTGVPLATLFREVGASPKAGWFLAEAMDAAVMTRSIPIAKAYDDAMIVYAQNGEAIRPEQGYPVTSVPARLRGQLQREVAPTPRARRPAVHDAGGNVEVHRPAARRHRAHVQLRHGRQVRHHRARVARPADRSGLVGNRGLAWSGRGRISRVDVSADGGKTWRAATLDEPVLPKCHTRFRLPWQMGRRRSGVDEPRDRRDRLRAADDRRADGGARPVARRTTSTTSAHGASHGTERVRLAGGPA